MRAPALLIALTTLLSVAADRSSAQAAISPSDQRGVTATLGLSKGSAALICPFCTGAGKGSVAGMLGIETGFRRGIRLGLEVDWWMYAGGGATRTVLAAAPVAHFRSPTSHFVFKVGLGLARFQASSDEEELRTAVIAGLVGLAYELNGPSRYALVPYVSWLGGAGGAMRLNGAQVTPLGGLSLLQYGLALTGR